MKAYLAGPMSRIPHCNFPLFDAATMALRSDGWDVVSPAELDSPEERQAALKSLDGTMQGESWGTLLARDLQIIADEGVEVIVVLPGWEKSKGARLETFVGRLLKLPILAYPSLNPIEQYHLERVHSLYVAPEGIRLSPGEVVNWSGKQSVPQPQSGNKQFKGITFTEGPPPVDTAESVQADAEMLPGEEYPGQKKDVQEARAKHKSFTYLPPERNWDEVRTVDPRTGGEKGAKQAVLGDAAPETLTELARVYGFGRKKYDRLNYLKGYDWSLSYDACERHLRAFWERKELDQESGLHHLAHACWHTLTLMAFSMRNLGTDDRP